MTSSGRLEVSDESDRCAFCDYLKGARPYSILWRDPEAAVLVTREQRGISHLLVVTQRHVANILDLDRADAAPLMLAVRDAARTIHSTDERPGISVWQNNGFGANQTIGHLHFHVAGTLPGGGTDFGDVPELELRETERIAERLRPNVPTGTPGRRIAAPLDLK